MSASLGVRDSNEASWTQVLEVVEFMADATQLPILLDGDTGFGNFNSVRRLVRMLEQRGVAGVCLEDKLFPKTNSLLEGGRQELVDPREFAGKIRAAKDTQYDRRLHRGRSHGGLDCGARRVRGPRPRSGVCRGRCRRRGDSQPAEER